jgi:hypothetical protein
MCKTPMGCYTHGRSGLFKDGQLAEMSCRTGLLRGGRSLRDLYTPSVGAPVGLSADHREARGEAGISVTK